jgi:hypothetical protein
MGQPFVLERDGHRRWSLYPPVDPYGDGYVARLRVEVLDDGLSAETTATIDRSTAGSADDLGTFLQQLADNWRGWPGNRVWHALENEMTVDARHDGRGYVTLGVMLRRCRQAYIDDAWSARVVFTVEAGEEMSALAREVQSLLGEESRKTDPR